MDLHEIGAMLREERERQGLSIEAVSDKIKITCSCLTAIEEGNEGNLPHPVYAKGFIKNYAKLLGVDQEDFSKHLSEVYRPEEDPSLNETSILRGVREEAGACQMRSSSGFPLPAIGIVGLLVLLLAGLGWYYYAHSLHTSDTAPESTPVSEATPRPASQPESERPIPTVPPATPATQPSAEAATPASQAPVASTPTATPSADDRTTQDIATSGPAAGAPPATIPPAPESGSAAPGASSATPTLTVGENGPHTVTITAKSRCWVQAGADGGSMQERTLEKGDVFVGRFADNLIVRLGNAGAVDIRFDNKLYPLQAGKGSVKTLKFVAKKTEGETAAKTPSKAEIAPPATPAAAAQSATAEAAPAVAKEVEIYGQDGSWLIVNPDKGPAKEIYVKKGQKITVPFDEKVEIRLGNPSSVVFRYGGKDMPVTTGKGETKSVRFP